VKSASFPAGLGSVVIEAHYLIATWRNVCIAVWIDETPAGAVRDVQQLIGRMGSEWPEGIAFLQVIGEDNQTIDGPARAALKSLLLAGRGALREAPVVYEGTGFRAAAIRAIVTGLLSQRSFGFPNRVYSTVDEAALTVARRFEKREPTRLARELCEALAALRDRHQRDFPTASHSFIRYRG
jgi:hypothetical protein